MSVSPAFTAFAGAAPEHQHAWMRTVTLSEASARDRKTSAPATLEARAQ